MQIFVKKYILKSYFCDIKTHLCLWMYTRKIQFDIKNFKQPFNRSGLPEIQMRQKELISFLNRKLKLKIIFLWFLVLPTKNTESQIKKLHVNLMLWAKIYPCLLSFTVIHKRGLTMVARTWVWNCKTRIIKLTNESFYDSTQVP